jgi:dihydroorotate dehydrogenase (fumarate)
MDFHPLTELIDWVNDREYESIAQMRGNLSLAAVSDPTAYERANDLKVLRSYALADSPRFPA